MLQNFHDGIHMGFKYHLHADDTQMNLPSPVLRCSINFCQMLAPPEMYQLFMFALSFINSFYKDNHYA